MKKFDYNKQRHLELLKKVKSSNKILPYDEGRELYHYAQMLGSCLHWETRDYYLNLIEKFLSGKIHCWEFRYNFRERYDLNREVLTSLQNNFLFLTPNSKSIQFSTLINEIIDFGDLYMEIAESAEYVSDETDAKCQSEYQDFLGSINVKIQNLLKAEN